MTSSYTTTTSSEYLTFNTNKNDNNTKQRKYSSSKGYKISDSNSASSLALRQGIIFGTLFLGYASYTYSRKCFSYAAPTLIGLNMLSQSKMGLVNSSQYFAYAISKFLGGILSDKISPRLLFPAGLFVSGFAAVCVPFSSDPRLWALVWFINGLGQGCGWPACSKIIKNWFSTKQFGTCWSLLTASSNVSGAVGPLLSAFLLMTFDWKVSFIVSGLFSILIASLSLLLLQDSPKVDPNSESVYSKSDESSKQRVKVPSPSKDSVKDKGSYSDLLRTPLLWVICACYLIVFSTKTALSDWGQVFLMQELGQTQMQASTFNSALETGGFVGGILAGIWTDKLNKKSSYGNSRLLVSTLFMTTCSFALYFLVFMTSPETSQVLITAVGMICGGALFGPISIFGIVASESFDPAISGASHAVVALAANVGAILAGWPASRLALNVGWKGVFMGFEALLLGASAIIFLTAKHHQVEKRKTN